MGNLEQNLCKLWKTYLQFWNLLKRGIGFR